MLIVRKRVDSSAITGPEDHKCQGFEVGNRRRLSVRRRVDSATTIARKGGARSDPKEGREVIRAAGL